MKLFYPPHPPTPLSTHERKLNKTKQMAARRTAQRRRTRCPLPSRSRLVLNEVSGFFFFFLISLFFFSSSCVRTLTQTHGVRVSPGFFISPDIIKTVVSLSLCFAADFILLIIFSTWLTKKKKKTPIMKACYSIFTLGFCSFGDSPARSDSERHLYSVFHDFV